MLMCLIKLFNFIVNVTTAQFVTDNLIIPKSRIYEPQLQNIKLYLICRLFDLYIAPSSVSYY